jgi:hypothetical protein
MRPPGRRIVIEQQTAHDEGSGPPSYKGVRARSRHALPPLPFQADECAHTDGHHKPKAELNSADSGHKAIRHGRRIGETKARREPVERCGRNPGWNLAATGKRISRHQVAEWCSGKGCRLNSLHKGGGLVILLRPWRDVISAQAVVQREVGAQAEAVLCEKIAVGCGLIEGWRGLL